MTSVQEALSEWKDAKCLKNSDLTAAWEDMEVELWSVKSSVQKRLFPTRRMRCCEAEAGGATLARSVALDIRMKLQTCICIER